MLLESIGGPKIPQVRPSDINARPEKSGDSVSSQKQPPKIEEIVKEKEKPSEITQEMLDVLGENFKMMHNVDLHFSIHEATGRTLVRVINSDTGEMVREIPPEQILNLAAKLNEMMGILYDQKV